MKAFISYMLAMNLTVPANFLSAAQAGGQLLALGEASPDLHANTNAAALFAELRHAEDNVAFARRFYNDAVEILRTRAQSFPDSLVAPWVRVPNLPLFNL